MIEKPKISLFQNHLQRLWEQYLQERSHETGFTYAQQVIEARSTQDYCQAIVVLESVYRDIGVGGYQLAHLLQLSGRCDDAIDLLLGMPNAHDPIVGQISPAAYAYWLAAEAHSNNDLPFFEPTTIDQAIAQLRLFARQQAIDQARIALSITIELSADCMLGWSLHSRDRTFHMPPSRMLDVTVREMGRSIVMLTRQRTEITSLLARIGISLGRHICQAEKDLIVALKSGDIPAACDAYQAMAHEYRSYKCLIPQSWVQHWKGGVLDPAAAKMAVMNLIITHPDPDELLLAYENWLHPLINHLDDLRFAATAHSAVGSITNSPAATYRAAKALMASGHQLEARRAAEQLQGLMTWGHKAATIMAAEQTGLNKPRVG